MIAIVTDSTACMTRTEAEALGVVYVNMDYHVAGLSYRDGFINNSQTHNLITDTVPAGTSQVTPTAFINTFTALISEGFEVLCIPISSRLSGTYNNAMSSAEYLGNDRIRVVDSKTTGGGLLIMIKQARKWINEGYSLNEVAKKLEAIRPHIQIAFSVGSMAPLRRSGRLGLVRLSFSTALNLRPILVCVDGTVKSRGMARGRQEQFRELVKAIPRTARDMVIHYFKSRQAAEQLTSLIEQTHGKVSAIRKLCPTLGIHLGADVVGVAWID